MRTVKTALIGAGFVGPHHIEAARRLGFVEVVAVAGSSQASAETKASKLNIPKSYGNYEALLDDPEVEVIHNCTPNELHLPVTMAAIERGKHVIADKPLALNSADARTMLEAARKKGIVHAVTFNYRYNPLMQQARVMVGRGDLGQVHFVHGGYLQDWLLFPNDYNWRLEKEGGPSRCVADIGSHWCDLIGYLTRSRISEVLAEYTTVFPTRQRPKASREAFAQSSGSEEFEEYPVGTEDFASVLLRFENGMRGTFSVSQVSAGHKNGLELEINGRRASIGWKQERPNELWIGRRNEPNGWLLKDPSLLDQSIRHYAALPGGHGEAWADAFRNLLRNVYSFIAEGHSMEADKDKIEFPTFADGFESNCIVEAITKSARAGGVWTKVLR
ncbi:MAG: Gfo/Idh/MocA family oxidoreductase [Acidobacteria bacterium]|nr:Gfo/Idh/MocA family oxidoreductase [Acidobacteriota bacterium]